MVKPSGICKGSTVNYRCVFFFTTPTWPLQDMVADCPRWIPTLIPLTDTPASGSTLDKKSIIAAICEASASMNFVIS